MITPENARENQLKSAASRHRKKSIRETMQYMLEQPLKDQDKLRELWDAGFSRTRKYRYIDYVVYKGIINSSDKGRMDDILKLMEITGEGTESAIVEDSAAYFEAGELTDADRENN
ncbi:MAG: hypothetical protein LUD72_03950 [Bacteroidales bacterium]|nr:hypothetical protein [Bacteroidales bacterium]